jgi:hypothetical protein
LLVLEGLTPSISQFSERSKAAVEALVLVAKGTFVDKHTPCYLFPNHPKISFFMIIKYFFA